MRLNIQNYEILNFDDYSLIGSGKGISRIKSKNLIAAFKELQGLCDTPVEIEVVESILTKHRLEAEVTIRQLHEHLTITTNSPQLYFEEVHLLHGWNTYKEESIAILNQEIPHPLNHAPLHEKSIEKITSDKSLIIILPGSQDTTGLKHIYFKIASTLPKSFIVTGHFSPNTFTVTQPYSIDLGNPCLFCSLSRAVHFETQADGSCAWSAILNFCTSNAADFQHPKLSTLQHSMVIGLISRKIQSLISSSQKRFFQDNILTNSTINLHNGALSEEILPHWHMCDCLRINHVEHTA